MSERYSDMTRAVEKSAAVQQDMLRQQEIGNLINIASTVSAHVDAKSIRQKIDEGNELQMAALYQAAEQHREVIEELRSVDQSITAMHVGLHDDLTDIKHATFANWRDGVGKEYFYNYRNHALEYVEDYESISKAWLDYAAIQFTAVVQDYPNWKKDQWLRGGLNTGLFFKTPQLPSPPVEWLAKSVPVPKTINRIGLFILCFILAIFTPVLVSSTVDVHWKGEAKTAQVQVEEFLDDTGYRVGLWRTSSPTYRSNGQFPLKDGWWDTSSEWNCDPKIYSEEKIETVSGGWKRMSGEDAQLFCDLTNDAHAKKKQRVDSSFQAKSFWSSILIFSILGWGVSWINKRRIASAEQQNASNDDVIQQYNMSQQTQWREECFRRIRAFEKANNAARNEALKIIQDKLGFKVDKNLGSRWASGETSKVVDDVVELVDNEVRRPPSHYDWVKLLPMKVNRQLRPDLKRAVEQIMQQHGR